MINIFLPTVSSTDIKKAKDAHKWEELYDILTQPLHTELYRRGSFDFMDSLSWGQQLLLSYDYMRTQVGQGGFIQFIQNGYVSLLPDLIEQLHKIQASSMAKVLDDALKVYVLNREILNEKTNVQEFAQLYVELKEFEEIDERFNKFNRSTIILILEYATSHLEEFVTTT